MCCFSLSPVQSFFTDDLYPQFIAHDSVPTGVSNIQLDGPAAGTTTVPTVATTTPVAAPSAMVADLWSGQIDTTHSTTDEGETHTQANVTDDDQAAAAAAAAANPSATTTTASASSPASAASNVHDDPMLASLVQDCSIDIRMGIASFDLSPSQQHLVVAVYPSPFPPIPQDLSPDASTAVSPPFPHFMDARLLLFPLPHSSVASGLLGFYVSVGLSTYESVRDALSNRMMDTRDLARDRIEAAKEKWSVSASKATQQLANAKKAVFGVLGSLFGGGRKATTMTPTTHANETGSSASSATKES